jgi:hypothetical protein
MPMLPDLIINTMSTVLTLGMMEIVKFMPIIMVSTMGMGMAMGMGMVIIITNMELKENIVLEEGAVLSLQRS